MMASQQVAKRRFVRHPADIPIDIAIDDPPPRAPRRLKDVGLGGLACRSDRPLAIGTQVVVTIPLVQPVFHAPCSVVWCRRHGPGNYEVGVCFSAPEDVYAARLVEQICQIEHYRKDVLRREGRELDGETAAQEWIARYAAVFPALDGSPPDSPH